MYLLQYSFDIKYRQGTLHGNADGVSRIPAEFPAELPAIDGIGQRRVTTLDGTFMQRLQLVQFNDKWLKEMDLGIGQVKNNYRRDDDGMIMYGERDDARLVIPATMREEVLDSNHDYMLAGHGARNRENLRKSQQDILLAEYA